MSTEKQGAKPQAAQATLEESAQQEQRVPVKESKPAHPPAERANPIARFDAARERCIKLFGSEDRFMQEATYLLQIVSNTPSLQECTPASINGVLISVAGWTGLSLNPVMKLVYIIPRNVNIGSKASPRWEKRATVDPSFVGMMKLATDSGAVRHFESHDVYAGDDFDFDLVKRTPSRHRPYWTMGNERGRLVGVYGWAVLHDGSIIPEHMGADELAKIQSKSDNANGSVYREWQGEMARKSLLKRLCKHIPRTERSDALFRAIEADNEQFDMDRQTASPAQLKPAEEEVRNLMAKAREAIAKYTGEDKATLRKKMADEASSGRQNPEFWREMLFMLTGEEQA